MNLTYTTPLPVSSNNPSVDQPNMTINNSSNYTIWTVDHYGFGDNSGGWHKQVTFPVTLSAPTVASPKGIITTQTVTNSELFYTNAQGNFQLTNSTLTASNGSGMMPGGLQIRSGTASGNAGSSAAISFNTAFPTNCISVVVCYSGGGSLAGQTCSAGSQNASGFTLFLKGGSATGVFYIAVGY